MHAISSYRGNRHRPPAHHKHTNTPTKAQTQRGPITIYTAPLASAQDAREDTIRRLFNSNIISRHQRPWRRYAHYAECNIYSLSFTHIRNGYDLLRTIVSEEVDLFTNEFATDPQPKAEVAWQLAATWLVAITHWHIAIYTGQDVYWGHCTCKC